MTVDETSALHAKRDGQMSYFCSEHCRQKFLSDPSSTKHAEKPPGNADYTCPMHPEVRQDRPGDCPKCGMALEPMTARAGDDDEQENSELHDMTRRFWIGAALTLPVFILAMAHMIPALAGRPWRAVLAPKSGYIQSVDNDALMRLAREQKTVVRMERGIGEFAVQDTALLSLALEAPPNPETIAALQETFSLSRYRTLEQDAAFGVRQIVDVALKALSPGINDTTTAVTCVDYLTTILARLAPRPIPASHRYEDGELRLIARGASFPSLLSEAFDQIRESAQGNAAIILKMVDALETIAGLTSDPERRQSIREEVERLAELAGRTIEVPHDRARVESGLARAREAIETQA